MVETPFPFSMRIPESVQKSVKKLPSCPIAI